MLEIKKIYAYQILDSRGWPTIEVQIIDSNDNIYYGQAPSGSSIGQYEALELRDNNDSKSVISAVNKVNNLIAPQVIGFKIDASLQILFDSTLMQIDSTINKYNCGANSLIACSIAYAKATKAYDYNNIKDFIKDPPLPIANLINGGKHANNDLLVQEFLIIPCKSIEVCEAIFNISNIYQKLKIILLKKNYGINTGDEGGFAANIDETHLALDLIIDACLACNLIPGKDIYFGLDIAASELYDLRKKTYKLDKNYLDVSSKSCIDYYKDLCSKYPIIYLEDPFADSDLAPWSGLCKFMNDNKILLVGDDLLATNPNRIINFISKDIFNASIIKYNQIGTISEAELAIKINNKYNIPCIASHRSGDTEDSFLVNFAIKNKCKYLKIGAPSRGERTSKYNHLLRILQNNFIIG